jgi:hypothetical protein
VLEWLQHGRRGARAAPVPLILYTRPGCGLCVEMKAEIERAGLERPYTLTEVDIDGDTELLQRYGESIPVLTIAGRVAFKGRLSPAELRKKFRRITAGRE